MSRLDLAQLAKVREAPEPVSRRAMEATEKAAQSSLALGLLRND